MNPEDSMPVQCAPSAAVSKNVTLSPWVNEQFPAWEQLLSAHDVARLCRRPRWALRALVLVGQLPKPRRFRGRAVGWHRHDIEHWLARSVVASRAAAQSSARIRHSGALADGQLCLFGCRSYRRTGHQLTRCMVSTGRRLRRRRHGP
jgi:predicted DNA-binding transcriptional regulator AlpA